jgi:HEAT repeat protein
VDLSGFGPPVVDRIMQEVNNPAVTPDVKNRLTNFISVVSRHDLLPKYQSLLRSNNPAVVHAAAIGMYRSLTPADSALVQAMLKDPSDSVRVQALTAIQTKRIWIDSFGPDLIQILHDDPNDIVRSQATALLGIHHVLAAEPDLTKALQDRSMFVRQSAQYALKKLKG